MKAVPAEKPVPSASSGSKSAVWVVQLGVFASRVNAERLADELKGKGFKVAVSESPGNGRTLYRVHSGTLSDRAAAQDLAAKFKAAGASGSVIPRS
jgi:cell division septation protein DedD